MRLNLDPHVRLVAEFMQKTVPADKLIFVASAIDDLSSALWAHLHPNFDPEADYPVLSLDDDESPGTKN